MTLEERIVIDPEVLAGKPVIRGTRLAVESIIDLFAQGRSERDVLNNSSGANQGGYPGCFGYASRTLKSERVYPWGRAA